MSVLGSRRGGLITLVAVAAAIVAAVTFLVFQFADRPQVATLSPEPGSAVDTAQQVITFSVDGDRRLSDLHIALNGKDVTDRARSDGNRVMVPVARLKDGTHDVAVTFRSSNVFSRSVDTRWSFEVDTVAPPLTVRQPARGAIVNRTAVRFAGASEPGATVTVAHGDAETTTTAGPRGGWTVAARLPEGIHPITITAADRAGNTTQRAQRLGIDTTAPNVQVSAPAGDEPLTLTDEPLIYGSVTDDNPRALTYSVKVNGRVAVTAEGASAPAAEGADGLSEAAAGEDGPLQIDGRKFALAPGPLPQGRNRVVVTATDAAGNSTDVVSTVVVETSERFGEHDMVVGATGEDVVELQERLREAGVYPKKADATGTYDKVTVDAVRRYQRTRDLPVNGQVDARMRQAMVGRIVVNLTQRKLTLIRDGKVVKTYPVAIGTASHPTPLGTYDVIEKQTNPTWFPPNSPWAAGLGPIPPGPGNPLGTRWIGTSAPAIGIHGTYADYSIGTAASHGCIRMHIPDVEELYEQVSLGMKVTFRA